MANPDRGGYKTLQNPLLCTRTKYTPLAIGVAVQLEVHCLLYVCACCMDTAVGQHGTRDCVLH